MSAINQVDYNNQWKKTNFVDNPNLSLNPNQEFCFGGDLKNETMATDYLHSSEGMMLPPGCVVSETQANALFQANLHISKLVEEQELRLQYQRRSLELKTEYRMKRELLECIISCTEEGRLVLSICDGDRVVKSKHLINAVDYSSIRYFTTYPTHKSVLAVSWSTERVRKRVIFDEELLSPRIFWKAVKSQGLRLLVSGRKENEIADVLYSFTIDSAHLQELPFTQGWCKFSNEQWKFITKEDLTLKEVLQDDF